MGANEEHDGLFTEEIEDDDDKEEEDGDGGSTESTLYPCVIHSVSDPKMGEEVGEAGFGFNKAADVEATEGEENTLITSPPLSSSSTPSSSSSSSSSPCCCCCCCNMVGELFCCCNRVGE